jgi:hypothetical protein
VFFPGVDLPRWLHRNLKLASVEARQPVSELVRAKLIEEWGKAA